MSYTIARTAAPPPLTGAWDAPRWAAAETLSLTHFHERSKSRHPRVQARLLHDEAALYLAFRVDDQYVRVTRTEFQASVCRDSCVEFFVQPRGEGPYLNFEINAGGALLCTWIRDPTRGSNGFRDYTIIGDGDLSLVEIHHSLPRLVFPEVTTPLTWTIMARIPRTFIERFAGPLGPFAGQRWRANLYKCADATSHPHWLSWAPILAPLNFHLPQFFAPLHFA